MNFPGATVIALNGAQSIALLSCLLLPLICVLVVLLLGNKRRQAGRGEPVPDWSIPAIDAQASGRSLFHTWAPAVKIAALLATSFLLVSLNSLTWALAALVLCALAVQLTGMPWTRPLKRLAALGGFLGMLVVILPLTSPVRPGDTIVLLPWLDSWPLNLAGVFLALTIVCKAAAVALLMEPMLATAPLARTLQGLTDLGLPAVLNQMILLCHRYIFVFQQEMHRMQRSMRVRGFAPRTDLATLRTMGNGFGMLFIRSFERTERVYEAMLSRGYQGIFPGETRQKITSPDLIKGALCILIGLLLLAGDRLLPGIRF